MFYHIVVSKRFYDFYPFIFKIIVELENGEKIYLKNFKSGNLNEFIDFVKHHDLLE